MAFTHEAFDASSGWPLTKRWDFDQTFLQRLAGVMTTVDACRESSPSYVFRWGSTRTYLRRTLMRGPSDVEWCERVSEVGSGGATEAITPAIDSETVRVLDMALKSGAAVGYRYNRA